MGLVLESGRLAGAEAQPADAEFRMQNADAAIQSRRALSELCILNSNYFTASIAFITSSSPMPSSLAVPGSSERVAKTSVPMRPNVTVSCLFSA